MSEARPYPALPPLRTNIYQLSKSASTYADEPWQKDMINKTHAFLLSHLTWLGVDFIDPSKAFEASDNSHQVRVLDYACGPGTITNILLGHATEFLGVDLSENMVNEYNKRFTSTSNDGKSKVNAKAVVGDLIAPDGPTDSTFPSEYFGFDLAVVGFGFHHFQDLKRATERLVSRLKPGGVFMVSTPSVPVEVLGTRPPPPSDILALPCQGMTRRDSHIGVSRQLEVQIPLDTTSTVRQCFSEFDQTADNALDRSQISFTTTK